jgi:Fe2+ or Zn2+ uptake regulation protein
VSATVDRLAEAEGFQPHSHRVDILGLCKDCR